MPQQLGSMSGFPAVVSYKATPDSEPILLRSSHNVEPVRILEERAFQRYVGSRTVSQRWIESFDLELRSKHTCFGLQCLLQ